MENRFLNSFENLIILKVKTKNMDRFLNSLYKLDIDIYRVNVINYKEVIVEINEKEYSKIKRLNILNKINIIGYKGKKNKINIINYNKILLLSLFVGLCILIFLTNIIFKIEIKHSSEKIRNFVMEELNKNDIKTMQFRKNYKELEKIKNKVLNDNKDKLEWLEIERIGTKYIIKVEERKIKNITKDYKFQDIISNSDAVIKKIVATNGIKVKEVNEYVKKGDTIITGSIYLNDKIKKIVKATGEVYGEVWYKLSIEYPLVNDIKGETGKSKKVLSLNFFDKNIILFNKNKYKNSNVVKEYIFKNSIIPFSISYDTIYELKEISGIYTEGEGILNAREYSKRKIQEMLDNDEYIISSKVLKYNVNSNTIYMDIFYKLYMNITDSKEIKIEEGYHD